MYRSPSHRSPSRLLLVVFLLLYTFICLYLRIFAITEKCLLVQFLKYWKRKENNLNAADFIYRTLMQRTSMNEQLL